MFYYFSWIIHTVLIEDMPSMQFGHFFRMVMQSVKVYNLIVSSNASHRAAVWAFPIAGKRTSPVGGIRRLDPFVGEENISFVD